MQTVRDWLNGNIFHVLTAGKPAGYVEMVNKTDWKAFNVAGDFIGWYTSKRDAISAIN